MVTMIYTFLDGNSSTRLLRLLGIHCVSAVILYQNRIQCLLARAHGIIANHNFCCTCRSEYLRDHPIYLFGLQLKKNSV